MTVAAILSEKGRHVITSPPAMPLQQIAQEMTRHRIGSLVIVDAEGAVIGLISERDLVAAVALHGAQALREPVANHMRTNPMTAHENDTIDSMMQLMTQERCRHATVMRNFQLSGLISIGDVVKHRIRVIEEEHRSMREYIAQA